MNEINLESKWKNYATGSRPPKTSTCPRPSVVSGVLAAAGAAVFSLPSHANAGIVYSGPLSDSASWNNAPGATYSGNLFTIAMGGQLLKGSGRHTSGRNTGGHAQNGFAALGKTAGSNSINVAAGNFGLKKLAKGSLIDSHLAFGSAANLKRIHNGAVESGSWAAGKPYFAGVEFSNSGGGEQYGWIELEYTTVGTTGNNSPYPGSIEALGYAYETDPGTAIEAGQTVDAVPEPASLASLALGAAGILALRCRRKVAQASNERR